jgi:NADH-quinone oxidoreductase subunit J
MTSYSLLLILMLLFSVLAVISRNMLLAAISLGVASVALTLVLFALSAPWAAVFELSVCAGLITVLFVSAVSMIRKEELFMKEGRVRFVLLPLWLAAFGAGLWFWGGGLGPSLPEIPTFQEPSGVGVLLWGPRIYDLMGQACIILAGVLVIRAFFAGRRD